MTKAEIDKLLICREAIDIHRFRDRSKDRIDGVDTGHTESTVKMLNVLSDNGFPDFLDYLKWDEEKCYEHYKETIVIEGACDGCVGYDGVPPCRLLMMGKIQNAENCVDAKKYEKKIQLHKDLFINKLPNSWTEAEYEQLDFINNVLLGAYLNRKTKIESVDIYSKKLSKNAGDKIIRNMCPDGHGFYVNLSNSNLKFDVAWNWMSEFESLKTKDE